MLYGFILKQEFNTSVSRAFAEKHQDVVDFLLRQMNGEKIVLFVRVRILYPYVLVLYALITKNSSSSEFLRIYICFGRY